MIWRALSAPGGLKMMESQVDHSKRAVSQSRLLFIDAALVIGGVMLLACVLMKLGEVFLGRPAVSWGIPAHEWALAAVCLLVFAGALCTRSLLTAGAPERPADLAAQDAPEAARAQPGKPLFPAPVSPAAERAVVESPPAAAEPQTGGTRGNALARAAAAEERRQALLRESDAGPAEAAAAPSAGSATTASSPSEPKEDETPPAPEPATAPSGAERKPKPPRLRAVDPGGSFL